MGKPTQPPKLVWIDLETSGLDAETDVIFEIGLIITSTDCDIEVATQALIRCDELPVMDETVDEMHAKNGLLDELQHATLTEEEVEQNMLTFLADLPERKIPMCGSTVGFDRTFLKRYMPKLEQWFHYRNGDISALQEFINLWRPDVVRDSPWPNERHRALPDLRDSIGKAHYYRNFILSLQPEKLPKWDWSGAAAV